MVTSHGDGRLAAMGIFAWLLSGLIAGAIARVFAPSPKGLGCIGTIAPITEPISPEPCSSKLPS